MKYFLTSPEIEILLLIVLHSAADSLLKMFTEVVLANLFLGECYYFSWCFHFVKLILTNCVYYNLQLLIPVNWTTTSKINSRSIWRSEESSLALQITYLATCWTKWTEKNWGPYINSGSWWRHNILVPWTFSSLLTIL